MKQTINTIIFFLSLTELFSQVPANDECNNAINLTHQQSSTCGTLTQGTVKNATQSKPPDICDFDSSDVANDVWYSFTTTGNEAWIEVKPSIDLDAVVIMYDGCNGNVIACSDYGKSGGEREIVKAKGLNNGNKYFFRIYAYADPDPLSTEFDVCVHNPVPAPDNDNCSGASMLVMSKTCTPLTGDVISASESGPADSCNEYVNKYAYDVWYRFTALNDSATIIVTPSPYFYPFTFLYESCGAAPIACNDMQETNGDQLVNNAQLKIGKNYYIRVFGYDIISSTTTFDICVINKYITAINERDIRNDELIISPNPANNEIYITCNYNDDFTVDLLNMAGESVSRSELNGNKTDCRINTARLPNGIYLVKVNSNKRSFNKRLVITH